MNTPVLTVLVKMSVFFFCIFHFGGFSEFPTLWEMLLIGSQNSKHNKTPKQEKLKTATTRKQDAKEKYCIVIQNKIRQQTETQKLKNILKQTQIKQKQKAITRNWHERKEERKEEERERERDKERESEKEGDQKRLNINKGRHRKINKNALFRGETVFCISSKGRKAKKKHKNKQKNKDGLGPSEVALKPSRKQTTNNQTTKKQRQVGPSEVALWATSPDP